MNKFKPGDAVKYTSRIGMRDDPIGIVLGNLYTVYDYNKHNGMVMLEEAIDIGWLQDERFTVTDKQLDQYHYHELIDRIHCVQVMIQELLMDHPASGLIGDKFRLASEQFGEAYQQLGRISFDEFGEEK